MSTAAVIGSGSKVWHLAQVRENAVIGDGCIVGRGAYIGEGVRIGDRVKIQNYAMIYEPATVSDGAFIGPGVIFTNDTYPRAVDPAGRSKAAGDWTPVGVRVGQGASVGARAVCVAPVTIGEWALVGAGAVVVSDVLDFALVVGNPARQIGWVGRDGSRLVEQENGEWVDGSGESYALAGSTMTKVTQ